MAERIEGTLERIIFFNEEKHYCVADFSPEKGEKIVVTGVFPGVECGEYLQLEGEWVRHPRHGAQFRATSFESRLPASVHGIRKYLGSGLISGIGKTYARKIVDHFGTETIRVISEESARLREVPGIGKERARAIKQAWDRHHAFRSVMIFLQTYGVTPSRCLKLVKRYGEETEAVLRSNPYRLASEVDGIGFKTADAIAVNLGLASDGRERIAAGLVHVGKMAEEEGHTALPRGDWVSRASELLGLAPYAIDPVLDASIGQKCIVALESGTILQGATLAGAEQRLARAIIDLATARSQLPPIKIDAAVQWARERAEIDFAPAQEQALRLALQKPVAVLTGGPGTGKTTILRVLVSILQPKKVRVALASPTGRAAQRLSEATGMEALTIHRLLEFDPATGGFLRKPGKPIEADYVIIDESSMLDTFLAASLIAAIRPGAHLLLVGDADQLPSVGPGNVLRDIIASGSFPVVRLDRIFRQASGSHIVGLAHSILAGQQSSGLQALEAPDKPALQGEVQWLEATDSATVLERIIRLVKYLAKACPGLNLRNDLQVLSPMHKGEVGVANLNERLREILNPGAVNQPGLFAAGDKVMQNRNNYELGIYNGDIGMVEKINPGGGGMEVTFGRQKVELGRSDFSDLSLAYAVTVHKSQGSEYPVVILPLVRQHFVLLQRNLLYTAVTRAKAALFLVGDQSALSMAVKRREGDQRITHLVPKIQGV